MWDGVGQTKQELQFRLKTCVKLQNCYGNVKPDLISWRNKEVIIMIYAPLEKGQGMLEYALIISLVVLIVIVVLAVVGPAVGNMFSNVVYLI